MTVNPAMTLLERETRRVEGPVPASLGGPSIPRGSYAMRKNELLLKTENGAGFHYRRGEGVTLQCDTDAARGDADLWFNGSVYSAIAAMNGLIPLHASAVEVDGKVIAFTGPSGAGKSTLVAGLVDEQISLFCDDTLILDPQTRGAPLCLPGHKRLKLDRKAADLSGAELGDEVSPLLGKYFASPSPGQSQTVAPLDAIILLRNGTATDLTEVPAGEAIAALLEDHYTVDFGQQAAIGGRRGYWQTIAEIVGQVDCLSFSRPRDPVKFKSGLQLVRRHLMDRLAP